MKKLSGNAGKYILRSLTVFLSLILTAVIALLGVMFVLTRGPSQTAKRLFVLSVKETSAVGFLANIWLPDAEVDEILSLKAAVKAEEESEEMHTDVSLISLPSADLTVAEDDAAASDAVEPEETISASVEVIETIAEIEETTSSAIKQDDNAPDGTEIVEIKGSYYTGVMLIVKDSTRIMLGSPDSFGSGSSGLPLRDMCKKFNAIAGINAGGFDDPNGKGTGGIPSGAVIKDGELAWGSADTVCSIIGFTGDGILVVGSMTPRQALASGVEFACSFGPALIVNGEVRKNIGGGLNPRTAIGQRADGSVLLLVINGRQIGSLGATHDDVASVMAEYGAVNASNLDGGASSLMICDGEALNNSAYVYGERVLATAFLVAAGD